MWMFRHFGSLLNGASTYVFDPCVSMWTRIADDAIGNAVNAATYRKVDSPTFIDCSKLKAAAQFWACGDGVHVVLIPARLA